MENIEVQNCKSAFYGLDWDDQVKLLNEFASYLNRELVDESNDSHFLPAEDRKDSSVKILRGNTSFAAKGAEVVVLDVFADETCSSGTCALVEYKGSKYEICNDFIDSDNYAQFD
jgi:hypothetical protein